MGKRSRVGVNAVRNELLAFAKAFPDVKKRNASSYSRWEHARFERHTFSNMYGSFDKAMKIFGIEHPIPKGSHHEKSIENIVNYFDKVWEWKQEKFKKSNKGMRAPVSTDLKIFNETSDDKISISVFIRRFGGFVNFSLIYAEYREGKITREKLISKLSNLSKSPDKNLGNGGRLNSNKGLFFGKEHRISDHDVMSNIRQFAKENEGKKLSLSLYKKWGGVCDKTVIRERYGSFQEAIVKSGVNDFTLARISCNVDFLIKHFHKVWELKQKDIFGQVDPEIFPSMSEYQEYTKIIGGGPSKDQYARKYGSWVVFLKYYGQFRRGQITEEELVLLANKKEKRRRSISNRDRYIVLARAAGLCEMPGCKNPHDHIDHFVPFSLGGPDNLENLRALCLPCNLGKSNLTVEILLRTLAKMKNIENAMELSKLLENSKEGSKILEKILKFNQSQHVDE